MGGGVVRESLGDAKDDIVVVRGKNKWTASYRVSAKGKPFGDRYGFRAKFEGGAIRCKGKEQSSKGSPLKQGRKNHQTK